MICMVTDYHNQHTLLQYLRFRDQPFNESKANYYIIKLL